MLVVMYPNSRHVRPIAYSTSLPPNKLTYVTSTQHPGWLHFHYFNYLTFRILRDPPSVRKGHLIYLTFTKKPEWPHLCPTPWTIPHQHCTLSMSFSQRNYDLSHLTDLSRFHSPQIHLITWATALLYDTMTCVNSARCDRVCAIVSVDDHD